MEKFLQKKYIIPLVFGIFVLSLPVLHNLTLKKSAGRVAGAVFIIPETVKVPIFVYHSVRPLDPSSTEEEVSYDTTPELLRQELQYLKDNGFTTITFDNIADALEKGVPLPTKPIILSFDDGWHNQYQYAFPILKEFNAPGTFFVFTVALGKPHFLSWDEIKEMDKAGMQIGCHSFSHPYLWQITDPNQLKEEILGSKKTIEEQLGHSVTAFAFPFGRSSEESLAVVKEAGFRTARILGKENIYRKSNLFQIQSLIVPNNFNEFVRVLNKQSETAPNQ